MEIDVIELSVMLDIISEMTQKQMYNGSDYIRIAVNKAKKYIEEKENRHGE